MEHSFLSLAELNRKVKEGIKTALPDAYWVRAEIADLNENPSGHCYLELVEKGKDDNIIAKAKGIIWSFTYRMLKPYFFSATQQQLTSGLTVLLQVVIEFHELYGFSLVIKDIDPAYTVGEMALQKTQIIRQLKDEGVFDMNRQWELPPVPQRIAVISSPTAAGFEDFVTHLENNPNGYAVHWKLYPAIMQGKETEQSVIGTLDQINQVVHRYDAVVIIRGGGAQSDLGSFNSYWLAYHITQFPLPVLTGIGHEQDDSVVDLVAHTRLKTPTAVADFILSRFMEFEALLDDQQQILFDSATYLLEEKNTHLTELSSRIPLAAKDNIFEARQEIQHLSSKLESGIASFLLTAKQKTEFMPIEIQNAVSSSLMKNRHRQDILKRTLQFTLHKTFSGIDKKIALLENTVLLSDPEKILQKGYSITLHNGTIIKNPDQVSPGDDLETLLHKGKIRSRII
jgi:exodeoxyribonuclease VII large subunit